MKQESLEIELQSI